MSEADRSATLDLVTEATERVPPSVAPAAALVIRRLKSEPNAPDPVVWDAAAATLAAQGRDTGRLTDMAHDADLRAVASLIDATLDNEVVG